MSTNVEYIKVQGLQKKVFCIVLGVSLALQDVRFLGELFGPSAASIGVIVILFGFFLIRRNEKTDPLVLYVKELIISTAAISLILLPTQETFLFGEMVWVKALKVAISVALLLITLKYGQMFYILYKNLLAYVAYSYLITVYLGVFLEKQGLFPKVNRSFIHYTLNLTERPRGFATEPSTLAYSISIGIALFALIRMKHFSWKRILLCSLLVSGFLVTTSRGFVGTIALAVPFVSLVLVLKRMDWLNKRLAATLITSFLLVQSIFIGYLLRSSLWGNYSRGISDATREVWAQMSVSGLFYSPFGAGYQGLITAAPTYIRDYVQENSSRFSSNSLREIILTYSQSSDFAISPKTVASLFVITSGIFGLAFLFNLIYRISYFALLNDQVKFWEIFGVFLVLLTLLNYAGSLTSFAAFFLLGIYIERMNIYRKYTNVD